MLKYYKNPDGSVAGIDEAGRGCLAGPVVAAAVVLPEDHGISSLHDSKQLTESQREDAYNSLMTNHYPIGIGIIPPHIIDDINILQATYLAMHEAIDQLPKKPVELIVDGNRFKPYFGIVHTCVIKGDATYSAIAAASIIAKVTRDRYMKEQHEKYPHYHWSQNKGYPTKRHKSAIRLHGLTPLHRKSFRST